MIVLLKKIDTNWFFGELNGKQGFLPASYIQVVDLPLLQPQCVALHDFRVTDVEEKDCISFVKGDVINVIRRVDDNWAEGKLGDRIGIFPIKFVDMNPTARNLMKLPSNNTGPSRIAPPAPVNTISLIDTNISNSELTSSTSNVQSSSVAVTNTSSQSIVTNSTLPSSSSCLNMPPSLSVLSKNANNSLPTSSLSNVTFATGTISSKGNMLSESPNALTGQSPNALTGQSPNALTGQILSSQKRHSLCGSSTSSLVSQFQRSISYQQGNSNSEPQQSYRHSMEILNVDQEQSRSINSMTNQLYESGMPSTSSNANLASQTL